MSAIIFHWTVTKGTHKGIANPHARKRLFTRWSLMAKAFIGGRPNIYCVTNDDTAELKDAEINFKTFKTLEDALEYSENDGDRVYIEQGGADLKGFKHPKEAVYVFGSDYGELVSDNAISIGSYLPVHSEIAAGIVLSSRYYQWH